jgi:pimeloyl-ACP methyl ester carboxylesterase
LHGFPDHPPTATPFLAELGRRGRHVVAPWLRGYAPSPTAGPFDLAALTGDVLALIDRWSPGRAVAPMTIDSPTEARSTTVSTGKT